MNKWDENWRAFKSFLSLAVPTLGLAIAVGLLTDTLKGESWVADWNSYLNHPNHFVFSWWLGFATTLIATMLCALWLYQKLPEGLPVRTLQKDANPKPHKVLIVLLSPSNYDVEINLPQLVLRNTRDATVEHTVELTGEIAPDNAALEPLKPYWNWQQTLRALSLHSPELEALYLIGSKGKGGSHSQFDICKQWLALYFDPAKIKPVAHAADFEDIDEIQDLIHGCIEEARNQGFKDWQIMIDATGGLKTTSIAAAVVTLHNRVKFEYVTNTGNVVAYSMIFESHPYFSA